MRLLILLGFILFFFTDIHAQILIAFQGFEGNPGDNWNYIPPTQNSSFPQVVVGANFYGFGFAKSGSYSMRSGGGSTTCGVGSSNCLNGDSQGGSCTNNPNGTTVEFSDIDVSCYSNVTIEASHRSHFLCSGEGQGFDNSDYLFFEVRLNGGAWITIDTLQGASNHTWTYATNPAGSAMTVDNPWTYTLAPGIQTVAFRTRCVTNRSDEVYYIDDVKLSGNLLFLDPAWQIPDTVCESNGTIILDSLLFPSSTTGGVWVGSGISGNVFDPDSLSGLILITYSVGSPPCDTSQSHSFVVMPAANPSWTPPDSVCEFSTQINLSDYLDSLSTTGGVWSGAGVSDSVFDPEGLSGNNAITYTVGIGQCSNTAIGNIFVVTSVNPSWSSIDSVCEFSTPINLNLLLDSLATSGGLWSGNGVTDSIFNPAGLSGDISVTYTVGIFGCDTSLTNDIYVVPSSYAQINAPAVLCSESGILNLNSFLDTGSDTNGIWSGNGVTGNYLNTTFLSGQNVLNYSYGISPCKLADSTTISFYDNPVVVITGDLTVCEGSNSQLSATGGGTYLWSTGETTSSINFIPSANTIYYLTVTLNGCSSKDSAEVAVKEKPEINITDIIITDELCSEANGTISGVKFSGAAPLEITWFDGDGLLIGEGEYFIPDSLSAGEYFVVIQDAYCSNSMSFTLINDEYLCNYETLYIPNIFSPNADGVNDVLYIRGGSILEMTFRIFDRWGEKLFESNDPSNGWDGTFRGIACEEGVYVYFLKAISENDEIIKRSGTVTLVK